MKILALDASTEACSVALYNNGEITQRFQHQPQQQAKLLLPESEQLLADSGIALSQLDALAFCNGPGSFTGLRVATAAAHGIALAHDLPLIAVSTLLTLAYGEHRRSGQQYIASCIDARMHEVYYAAYSFEQEKTAIIDKDRVLPPQNICLPASEAEYSLVGNGWIVYRDNYLFEVDRVSEHLWPEAQDLASLAAVEYRYNRTLAPEKALPVYIRDNVAVKKENSV